MQMKASFEILAETDLFVLIADTNDGSRTITNDADNVVRRLDEMEGGLGRRRIYYRCTLGRYDELRHVNGRFRGFATCSDNQQEVLHEWAEGSFAEPMFKEFL